MTPFAIVMRVSAVFLPALIFVGVASTSQSELPAARTPHPRVDTRVPTETATIVGRVADSIDLALPGVSVIAIPETGGLAQHAQTGSDGTYRIGGLADGIYRVDFELLGFDVGRRNHVRVTVDATTRADGTLHLSPICECVTRVPDRPVRERRGQVLSESGHPLPHARLQVSRPWPEIAYADAQGRFVVRLPRESAPLTASDSGFRSNTLQVSGGASAPLMFRLLPVGTADVAENERLNRGCRCPGDLFTHPGR